MADNTLEPGRLSPFESIKRETEEGTEYWSARDLAKILGYTEYGKFKNAIKKAEIACENSDQEVADHFAHVGEMVSIGSKAKRKIEDVHLSRYACYLLVENSDPSKPIVALGQAYFVVQTRRQEIADVAAATKRAKRLTFVCFLVSRPHSITGLWTSYSPYAPKEASSIPRN